MRGLRDKVTIVTGAARGIGEATARRLHAEGGAVALLDLDEREGKAVAADLGEERALFAACDVSDEGQVAAAVAAAAARFGRVDALVNNAGVNAYFDPAGMTVEQWNRFMAVDLTSAWLCSKHVLPELRRRGGGVIVNIASIHAHLTAKGMFPYAAAKSGLVGLTRSLALEVAGEGIRVVAVCPGFVRTRLVTDSFVDAPDPAAAEAAAIAMQPIGHIADPSEIASVIAFALSDDASFVTGVAIEADGGLSARFGA
jgi:NAD(P)-dependent dehydrogenase (short-subunit alcohol dehydrogenase family)